MLYFGVILCFVVGAILGNWFIDLLSLRAIAVCAALHFLAFLLMFIDRERPGA